MNILLNNKPLNFDKNYLSCLIHGREKSGASHFSIQLISQLFLQREKIIFFTAYSQAKDSFIESIKNEKDNVFYIDKIEDLDQNPSTQVIIVQNGNEKLFMQVLNKLKDIKERVIFIKNIETYSCEMLEKILIYKQLIISGDLDQIKNPNLLSQERFKTIIVFSKAKNLQLKIPELEKYVGYFCSGRVTGEIRV